MDIWDSLRLTLRHWKFTAPVFLVGVILAFMVFSSVASSWKVSSTVILIGPTEVERVIDERAEAIPQNGYFKAGDTMTLTRVAILAFTDPQIVAAIEGEGLSVDYEMSWDNRQPLITTDVTADSPEVATATAERLIELLAEEIDARQTAAGAPPLEFATIDVLAVSTPKEDFASARLLGAVTFILAIMVTVGLAFTLERWNRRGEALADPAFVAPSVASIPSSRDDGAVARDDLTDERDEPDKIAMLHELPEQGRSAAQTGSRWTR